MAEDCESSEVTCAICQADCGGCSDSSLFVTLTRSGVAKLTAASTDRCDQQVFAYLQSKPRCVNVHVACQRAYSTSSKRVLEKELSDNKENIAPKKLRSCSKNFEWKNDCLYCGLRALNNSRHPDRRDHAVISRRKTRDSILTACMERADDWSFEVRGRIETCFDLVAVGAVYHLVCRTRFHSGLSLTPTKQSYGPDPIMMESFKKLCEWFETSDGGLFSMTELHLQMSQLANGEEVYSLKHFKQKLLDHYGDRLFIADRKGFHDVVCLRDTALHIVSDKWHKERKKSVGEESLDIVKMAAKLIKAQIKELDLSMDCYPTPADIKDYAGGERFIPPLLKIMMKELVSNELKEMAISQCIVQAARPRSVITPILFGLGVELDHKFGSRWLIDELARLGLSISYSEVDRYKQSIMQAEQISPPTSQSLPHQLHQFVCDNVDHNTATLNGEGTFHGMGIISISTNSGQFGDIAVKDAIIKRIERMPSKEAVRNLALPIKPYTAPSIKALSKINFRNVSELQTDTDIHGPISLDLLWSFGWLKTISPNNETDDHHPNWSGYMQHVCVGTHPAVSDITFLPIVDLNPSDETCIFSTLCFILEQSKKLNIITPCVTFDLPLWVKAVEISKASSMNIFCQLGGFHTLMSFVGSIGNFMAGSGLGDVLLECYGPNTVGHILSGKAISRALRGLFLVDAALSVCLISLLVPKATSYSASELSLETDEELSEHDMNMIYELSDDIFCNVSDESTNKVVSSSEILKLHGLLENLKSKLTTESRTAKLWILFKHQMETVRLFIRAARSRDWDLHMLATYRMLNLFAATGHIHYTKCARLYLQMMKDLPVDYPWLYEQFANNKLHVVRMSDRYWAGLWTDLIIEQVLMRTIKSSGGLTRGRGMSETVRLSWVYTMHQFATIHSAMTELTGLHHVTSEQHIELGSSRMKRDLSDLQKMVQWFKDRNPFVGHSSLLCSLSTGITATDGDGINCDCAEDVGAAIQKTMDGKPFSGITVKRGSAVKALVHLEKGLVLDDKVVHLNYCYLFHRLLLLAERSEDISTVFEYELTPMPASLFKNGLMRKPDKASFGRLLSENCGVEDVSSPNTQYVIDGGLLLHKVPWCKIGTYGSIADLYVKFVIDNYGVRSIIVFDGYSSSASTKDQEHERRYSKMAAAITISTGTPVTATQSAFLTNSENKAAFIALLQQIFEAAGIVTYQATSDADTLIVSTAIGFARSNQHVTVVSEDTDILVLLAHHWTPDMACILLRRRSSTSVPNIISIPLIRESIGPNAVKQLLAIHAFTGCDATSAIYGQGKGTAFKKLTSAVGISLLEVFSNPDATKSDLCNAGNQLMVLLYGGKVGTDTLDKMRYYAYHKLASSSRLQLLPERLPPTPRAVYFHSLRTYFQTHVWHSLEETPLDPCDWGWQIERGKLVPVPTDLDAAPTCLLKVIRCNCKESSRNQCGNNSCSCRSNGLTCSPACSGCHGLMCNNCEKPLDRKKPAVSDSSTVDNELLYDDDLLWEPEESIESTESQEPILIYDDDLQLSWICEETVNCNSSHDVEL